MKQVRFAVLTVLVAGLLAVSLYPAHHDQTLGFVGIPVFFLSRDPEGKRTNGITKEELAALKPAEKPIDHSVPMPKVPERTPEQVEKERRFNLLMSARAERKADLKKMTAVAVGGTLAVLSFRSVFDAMFQMVNKPAPSTEQSPDNAGGSSFQLPLNSSIPAGAPAGSMWGRLDRRDVEYQDGFTNTVLSLVYSPVVTVSGVGQTTLGPNVPQNNGAQYGPDTVGTTTGGLREAILAAAGVACVVVTGPFTVTAQTTLASGTWLHFNDASFTLGFNGNVFSGPLLTGLKFTGSVTFNGNTGGGFAGNGFTLLGSNDILFDWTCYISGFANSPAHYLILANPSGGTIPNTRLTITGRTYTADSTVIQSLDTNYLTVTGVRSPPGGMTGPTPVSVVNCRSDTAAGTITNTVLRDIQLDGGGVQTVSGLVAIRGATGAGNIVSCVVADIIARNTETVPGSGLLDGVDINGVTSCLISNVSGSGVYDGLSIIGSHVSIVNVVYQASNGHAVAVGDSSVMAESMVYVTLFGCQAFNCGQLTGGNSGGGLSANSTALFTVDQVLWNGCISTDGGGSLQKYGFQVVSNGTVTNIIFSNGILQGYAGAISNPSGATNGQLTVRNTKGVTDVGVIASPFDNTGVKQVGVTINGDTYAAAPTPGTVYPVGPGALSLRAQHGSASTITIKDAGGNFIDNAISCNGVLIARELEPGWTLSFGTAAPTTVLVLATRA